MAADVQSSTSMGQLPDMIEGKGLLSPRNSTSSLSKSSRPQSCQEQAALWASEVRQVLDQQMMSSMMDVLDDDVETLKQELVAVFITALQKDSLSSWQFLKEVLNVAVPYRELLQGKPDMYHYLERVIHHFNVHHERLHNVRVADVLRKVFPQEVKKITQLGKGPARNYTAPLEPRQSTQTPAQRSTIAAKTPRIMYPEGQDPFRMDLPVLESKFKPKPMTFGDLRASLPTVAKESANRESIWGHSLGLTAQALSTDLLEELIRQGESRRSSKSDGMSVISEERMGEEVESSEASQEVHHAQAMTGREAVEYFTRCYHTGKIRFMYFNIAPNRHFRPYDLRSTQKHKAKPEHYVFSTFGVLHVHPDTQSESLSLTDWQREAVLWEATSNIPFFKNYLKLKMFRRWKANIDYKRFLNNVDSLSTHLLASIPLFGGGLVQLSRLLQELLTLKFVPLETNKTYELGDFENIVMYKSNQAEKVLEKFYRYSRLILDTTNAECRKKLRYCEAQVQHKTVFSKDSLHLQRVKKQQREENLKKAKEEMVRLPDMMKLVHQIVLSHLVQIARANTEIFVQDVMKIGQVAPRDGLFKVHLVFNEMNALTINPDKGKFTRALSKSLGEIPAILCEAAEVITEENPQNFDRKSSFRRNRRSTPSSKKEDLGPLSDTTRRTALVPLEEDSSQEMWDGMTDGDTNFDSESAGWNTPSDIRLETPRFDDVYDRGSPDDHDFGMATPDLVLRYDSHDSESSPRTTIMPLLQPLSRENLEEKLKLDKDYKKALKIQEELMHESLLEIEQYCDDNGWLIEIYQFCSHWTDKTVVEYRNVPAFNIEQKLTEIRQWTERVRNFDHSFKTANGIFFVSCSGIHDFLVPKLNHIYKEMVTFIARESRKLAQGFVDEMNSIVVNLKNKDTALDKFAKYSKNVQEYKKNMISYQQRSDYIKSLFEVIRMCYRQLKPEEEKLEEQVQSRWEAFLFHIQDANEFLSIQTPLVTAKLEDTHKKRVEAQNKGRLPNITGMRRFSVVAENVKQNVASTRKTGSKQHLSDIALQALEVNKNPSDVMRLEEEANQLVTEATTGKYLDPKSQPLPMLTRLREILTRFYRVKSELMDIGRYKEDITGETYDTSYLKELQSKIEVRAELWKYVDVSVSHIKEWKKLLFKKMNGKKIFDKINEWQAIAYQFKKHVPVDDAVLVYFYRCLQDFKHDLPLLYKLSSNALKQRHWKTIFIGMGEQFDPHWNFTVEDLLAYNLSHHSLLINTVHQGAVSEYELEQKLNRVKKYWEEKQFKLAKHIPDSVYAQEKATDSVLSPRKLTRVEKFRQERSKSAESGGLDVKHDEMYTLIEIEELKYMLEDSSVTLQSMLVSPFLAELRTEAERWDFIIHELEEIIELWHTCQKKWLYLLKVFEDADVYQMFGKHSKKFKAVNKKFRDFMNAVADDPKVLSVVTKRRGEKGFKLLSGDVLKEMFRDLTQDQEEVLKRIGSFLDEARQEFPRLYFLSDQELVDLLGISRNPQALVPYVMKCFPGIKKLSFALPESMQGMQTALDYALNAHMMEVTAIHGILGEAIPLMTRIEAMSSAPKWMSKLELIMKSTMAAVLQACVQARLDEGSAQPQVLQLLDEIAKLEEMENGNEVASIKADIRHTFEHWLLRFPSQSVLVAEGVLFEQKVHLALQQKSIDSLAEIRENLRSRIEQYSHILREICTDYLYSETKQRLHTLVGNLINQTMHHRDILEALVNLPDISEVCYDWSKVLKYHMDMTSVLRAKTEVCDPSKPQKQNSKSFVRSADLARDNLKQTGLQTTVTSTHDLGQCLMHQLGYVHLYDHEYLGLNRHLIFTPLTERAYLTLSIALKHFNCGTLMGPAATGKSETIRDLSNALGRHLVTVNCSETVSIPTITQYLNGIIQAGSWVLFDDCERLDKGVMSVFAQHLDYLRTAYKMMDKAHDNQYKVRGTSKADVLKPSMNRTRRHSLTTLHPMSGNEVPSLERQATVPHGFNEQGLHTYFEDTWVKERERRHSIGTANNLKEAELYPSAKPPSLFEDTMFETAAKKVENKRKKDAFKQLAARPTYKPAYFSNVLFDGQLIKARANYGCFMTMNTQSLAYTQIPECLKHQMRSCALVSPDVKVILEMMLFCYGFSESKKLTTKIFLLWEMMQTQLPKKPQYSLTLRTLKTVLSLADRKLRARRHLHEAIADAQSITHTTCTSALSDTQEDMIIEEDTSESPPPTFRPASAFSFSDETGREEYALIYGLINTLSPKMENENDMMQMKNLVRDVFPQSARPKSGIMSYDPGLVSAIQEQMVKDNLQATTEHVNKILQLYSALQMKQGVILLGQCGTGKSTSYQTLARALNGLHSKKLDKKELDELKVEDGIKDYSRQKPKVLRESQPREASKVLNKWKRISGGLGAISFLYMGLLDENADDIPYPKVDLSVLTPNVFSTEELFGFFKNGIWQQGLLAKLIKESEFQVNSAQHFIDNFDEKKNKAQVEPPDFIKKWLVLDGGIQIPWVESLNTMLDDGKTLSLANRETAALKNPTSLLFEMNDLTNASPAMLTRCAIVNLADNNVHWRSLVESWGIGAKQKYLINSSSFRVILEMGNYIFTRTLKFFAENRSSYSLTADTGAGDQVASGVQEVTSFLNILSSLLERHYLREEWEKTLLQQAAVDVRKSPRSSMSAKSRGSSHLEEQVPNYISTIKSMFAYSFIWGFGGVLSDRYVYKFDELARECLYRAAHPVSVPRSGTVFDYHVDLKTGALVKWEFKQEGKGRSGAQFITTAESERYGYLVDLLLSSNHPVLLTGAPGVGKTSLVQSVVQAKHQFTRAIMSPGQTPATLQNLITLHVNDLRQKKGQPMLPGLSSNKSSTHHLFFLDDLNTAAKNHGTGCMPSLEFLRQLLTYKGVFDTGKKVFMDLHEAAVLAACTNPGSSGSGCGTSTHILPPRLARLFTTVTINTPTDEGLHNIYGRSIRLWLEEFPTYSVEHHGEFAKAMMQGMLDLYKLIQAKFRPTPAHAHYVFSLHDIAHAVQGILLMSPRSRTMLKGKKKAAKKASHPKRASRQESSASGVDASQAQVEKPPMMRVVARLWCHEVTRTFSDRLTLPEDMDWFKTTLHEVVNSHFCSAPEDMWKSELMASIREETHSQLQTPMRRSTPGKETPTSSLTSTSVSRMEKIPTPPTGSKPRKPSSADSASGPRSTHSLSRASSSLSSHSSEKILKLESEPDLSTGKKSPVPDTGTVSDSQLDKAGAEVPRDRKKGSETAADTEKQVSDLSKESQGTEKKSSAESGETETTGKESGSSDTKRPSGSATEADSSEKEGKGAAGQGVGSARSVKFEGRTSGADQIEPTEGDDEDDDETESSSESETESEDSEDSVDMTSSEVKAQLEIIRAQKLRELNKPGTPGHLSIRTTSSDSLGGKGALQTSTSSLRSTSTGGGLRHRRGVTFKSGLISDRDEEEFLGPLFSMDQIKDSHEDLSGFLFTKSILTCYTESTGQSVEKGYVEVTSGQLSNALKVCLGVYNEGTSQKLDLVFFEDAVNHITRLSRVLMMQGGNALLLGISYCTGRATITRLAAYIAKCKLFEPKPQQDSSSNRDVTREMIKRCCQSTGCQGRPSVLLIHEDLGEDSLLDVCSIMTEGTCPDLYSDEELQNIVMQMTPGSIPTKRVDKIEQTFEKFRKRVLQNLRVVVCLNYTGSSYQSLHEKLKKFPSLIRNCSGVDLFRPWAHDAFVQIANQWLSDRSATIKIPWSRTPGLDQIAHISNAMGYIHNSAKLAAEKQYSHMREPLKSVTPLTFMEFTHLFRVISASLVKLEQANIDKHKKALKEIDVAQNKITTLMKQKAKLRPKLDAANEAVEDLVKQVEQDKTCYIEALEKCRSEEEKIETMMGPLSNLKEKAQAEFDRINPIYYAALDAMKHLSINDYAEVKTYNAPPAVVKEVIFMICVMFGKTPDWENGKLLLLSEGFFNELEFYDKDNIPPEVFDKLGKFVENPRYAIDAVKLVSVAASALASWIHSVYHYGAISQSMKPRLAKLLDAEGDTKKAQAALGAKRVEAAKSRGALEQRINAHRDAVKQAKGVEKQIARLDRHIEAADSLMGNMESENTLWKDELASSEKKIQTAIGDALVAAASVCYFGPLDSNSRAELTSDWLARCGTGNFDAEYQATLRKTVSRSTKLDQLLKPKTDGKNPGTTKLDQNQNRTESFKDVSMSDLFETVISTRDDFCLEDILSSFEEQCEWRLKHMPTDLHAVQNGIIMRACCQNRYHVWPLLIDPDRQGKKWVKILQCGENKIREQDLTPVNVIPPSASASHRKTPLDMVDDDDLVVPPSRGTAITTTDITDYSLGDSVSLTESASNLRTQTSVVTPRVEDIRPVTTLMQGTLSGLNVEEEFVHPPDNLWVVEADDPSLDQKIINAIVYGVTVLVTNLERKPLDPLFRGILLRQFTVNETGEKTVRVGDQEFVYHPDFCLYLSTSVPLYITGDGIAKLPLQKMCVIDLSLSPEGVTNRLLAATLKYEKPEFEGQARALESDIIHQKHEITNEHDKIMENTLELEVPLLDDPSMVDALLESQENVEKGALILDETEFLQEQLEEKESLYIPVAENGSMVYQILKTMAAQNPLYHIPSSLFVKLFSETVESHQRGKFSTGVPKGRTKELTDATTAAIFRFASMVMSESDAELFALLIALETMKSDSKLTEEEYSWFVNGLDAVATPGEDTGDCPDWLTEKCWCECLKLETVCPELQGLSESLKNHSTEWKEYFKLPVALMNMVPDDRFLSLSIFQKVLVWKFCCPQRLFDVCQALVLHQLGGIAPQFNNYDIRDIYPMTACNVPVVFVTPPGEQCGDVAKDGYSLVSPAQAVQQYAKENKLSSRVKVLNFGTPAAMAEAKTMLEFCMQSGDWLVLQNTHLANAWPQDVLKLIRSVVTAQVPAEKSGDKFVYESESVGGDVSTVADGKSMMGLSVNSSIDIHRDFRLWVTGRTDTGRMLPGVLTQYGLKVSTSLASSLKSTLQRYYTMTEKAISTWEKAYQDNNLISNLKKFHLPLTILQAVLLHRRSYGDIAFNHAADWSHGDFVASLLLLKQLLLITDQSDGIVNLLNLLYGGQSTDECDKDVVEAVIGQVVGKQAVPLRKVSDELPTDLPSLLRFLEPTADETFAKRLEELVEVSSATLGLPGLAGHLLCANKSSALEEDLKRMVGTVPTSTRSEGKGQLIADILNRLENFAELPQTSRDHLYPLEIMLHFEIEAYKTLLSTVKSDLTLLDKATQGEVSLSPQQEVTYRSLFRNSVPSTWETGTFPSGLNLDQWLSRLEQRVELMVVYYKDPSGVAVFDLAAFQRPDRFIQCVLQNHSRRSFRDLHTFRLDVQFLPMSSKPFQPPTSGVYVNNLRLHNASWDGIRSVLKDQPAEHDNTSAMPTVWLKPVEITDDFVENKKDTFYNCPVYIGSKCGELTVENVVTHFKLPTVAPSMKWKTKRVYLSCDLR